MDKVLFIANGIWKEENRPGISGGDVRWIEIAKIWQKKGLEVHILTTQAGRELSILLGLKDAIFHEIQAPSSYGVRSYIKRFFASLKLSDELKDFKGIIYSVSEHSYDVIPGKVIKSSNRNNIFAVVAHWVAPLIRKGTSPINSILFYLNQRIGYYFTKKYADRVLAVSKPTAEALVRIGIPQDKIAVVECGVYYNDIRDIASRVEKKEFDAIFMKRFDKTKGVLDVIEIWKYVVREIKDAKLILVGHGSKDTLEELNKLIKKYGLENNIKILGPIYDFNKKIEILAKSKLFLLPSYEENWAIVIGEALAAGVPVICYDLPEIKPIWEDKIIWVPRGDKREFAKRIIELLQDDKLRAKLSKEGIEFVKKYDWEEIAKKELELILSR